jgi:hypothetical protein
VTACPYSAIFPEDEVPPVFIARGGEYINRLGLASHYEGINHHGDEVILDCVKQLEAGEKVNLAEDIQANYKFYSEGPGYGANG